MNSETKPNRRVLIVDDNQSIHDDYTRVLCPVRNAGDLDALEAAIFGGGPTTAVVTEGYELTHCLQGADAYQKVCEAFDRAEPFAVAFVDLRMPPGWDGVETIEKLWSRDPNLQVVICSAHSDYKLSDIVSRLEYPCLAHDTREVLRTLEPMRKEIPSSDGRWYAVRIIPYRTKESMIDGLVITFLDISETRRLAAELEQSRSRQPAAGVAKPD